MYIPVRLDTDRFCGPVTVSYEPCNQTVLTSIHTVDIHLEITIRERQHKIRETDDEIHMHVIQHKWMELITSSGTCKTTPRKQFLICY
jgi:hypothetical protein